MGQKRFAELDVLRGFAAIAVVLYHYRARAALPFQGYPLGFGRFGVQLFFCISGFVIFWTLTRTPRLADFAFSRFSRLYPTYWAALVLCALLTALQGQSLSFAQYAANATMLQTFLRVPDVDAVFWTLAIELVFYVWMAAFFALGLRHKMASIAGVWLALSATAAIAARASVLPTWIDTYFIVSSIPFFLGGVAFYLISVEGWRRGYVGVILGALLVSGLREWRELVVAALIFATFAAAVSGWLRWIVNPVTRWLGGISYALYLTHQRIPSPPDGLPGWANLLAVLGCALALASIFTYGIERPAIAWLRAWYGRRRSLVRVGETSSVHE